MKAGVPHFSLVALSSDRCRIRRLEEIHLGWDYMALRHADKSGDRSWSKDEERQAVELYRKMSELQQTGSLGPRKEQTSKRKLVLALGDKIGRSKGSVEAKLMNISAVVRDLGTEATVPMVVGYRPLSNMSTACRQIATSEFQKNKPMVTTAESEDSERSARAMFPEGLIAWEGHRDGGVRRPFQDGSGRPTGAPLETPLVSRLRDWTKSLVAGDDVPRAVLLVGGPGNGKTDAVERCIEFFDSELEARGRLVELFSEKYRVEEGELPPRKVVVDLEKLPGRIPPDSRISSISLVQDATEGDAEKNASAEEILLRDLVNLVEPGRGGIYLCCVNRGILASAAQVAHREGAPPGVIDLLRAITECVTSNPEAPSCWPVQAFDHIAVWPMDVESLVSKPEVGAGLSVAHQIFEAALAEEKWKAPCDLGTRCPFCQNRKLLSRKGAVEALVQLLHFYELASGKRWTFRDLFSLVPYLLVGDYSELQINGKKVSPCDWAAYQQKISTGGTLGDLRRDIAPYLLMSRLYHHRLFPGLPSFDRGDHRKAKQKVLKKNYSDEGLVAARAFFRFASWNSRNVAGASADIASIVRDSVSAVLDPAGAKGQDEMFTRDKQIFSIDDLENLFCISIREGLEELKGRLETLEKDVLLRLAAADESLVEEDRVPRNQAKNARLLQETLRQYACRIAKRSLAARIGSCRDVSDFKRYLEATRSQDSLKETRREFKKLLHDSRNKFEAKLATTFGQPIAERSRNVVLLLETTVSVAPRIATADVHRPTSHFPYLLVDKSYVPLTFDLFRSLNEIASGLLEASLPGEIYSLIDRVKALVSGRLVRDKRALEEDPVIELGSSGDRIEYSGGVFLFEGGDGGDV